MDKSRRDFLKIAGLSALGIGTLPFNDVLAQGENIKVSANPKALTAKRWAMVVDLAKFKDSGVDAMKACAEACHKIHNVPKFENSKDEVKWIWTEELSHALPEQEYLYVKEYVKEALKGLPVIVLCNHCDNPACVRVCPTKATFRRESDGLVLMDYHRCIGCRYCMAACPYGARSLNWRDPRPFIKELNREFPTRTRGVVEKCNFCAERLAVGLPPACVEACKNKEMVFGDLEDPESEVRKLLRTRFSVRRKPGLGTQPQVYYIV